MALVVIFRYAFKMQGKTLWIDSRRWFQKQRNTTSIPNTCVLYVSKSGMKIDPQVGTALTRSMVR
jgi:hypothetical protein